MLLTIVVILVVLIAGLLAYAATRPDSLRVERTDRIMAPADRIFPLINDLHSWGSWSPYERYDAAMKKVFSGAPLGKGAVYTWDGNAKVGAGRMEIIESTTPSRIVIKLDFVRPYEGHTTATFNLTPSADGTSVSWTMVGPSSFMTKLMGIFMNMDKMIGDDFARGLTNLRSVAER
ncbi:MAG: SRPBCC family protein [Gemmatimonadota bacterium]